jgi:hypothetical protein
MARTITAANAVYALTVAGLYDTPQVLQGFAADRAFETEAVTPVETVLGVDGIMSAGWLPTITPQTITLMPDSPSSDIFENWAQALTSLRETLFAGATILIPSTGKVYTLTRGVLSSTMAIPNAQKVLQARPWAITWQSITSANA